MRSTVFDGEDWAAFRACARPVHFRAGQRLFGEGDPSTHVVALVEGRVKVTVLTPAGRELLVAIKGQGELVGELGVVDHGPRSATATAQVATDGAILAADRFRSFLEQRPGLGLRLLRSLAADLRSGDHAAVERDADDPATRVARRLVDLAERFAEHDGTALVIRMGLTQEDLASWTGASRATVNAVLGRFRDAGWVSTGRGRIVVTDLDALRARVHCPRPTLRAVAG